MNDLIDDELSKGVLQYCRKIFGTKGKYMTDVITHISKIEDSEILRNCVASIFTILDDINQMRFVLYTEGISHGIAPIDCYECAESESFNHSNIKNKVEFNILIIQSAIDKIGNDLMQNVIKYGLYLINKNNLDITTHDYLLKMFISYIDIVLDDK